MPAVSVAARTKPLRGPLPGGREGATVRVRPLLAGKVMAPPGYFARPKGPVAVPRAFLTRRRHWVALPVPAFLVDHPAAGPVLVDTGFHASVATSPKDNLGALAARLYDLRMESAIPAQLEALGIDAHEVRTVVMTHLHLDHASGVVAFPHATFVVSAREWEAAATGRALHGYRPRQFDHAFDWRTVDYEGADVGSFASFGRSVDLFGDGSVRLVSTPGHSPGHQSLVLRLGGARELLLCGDAAARRRAIDEGELPALVADEHRYRRSLAEIRRYVEQTPDAVVVCGHDPEGFAALREVYH